MIVLEYCPEGICVADAKAMDFALSLVPACNAPEEQTIKFGNDMILSAVRVLVKRGQLNHEKIKVMFEKHTMIIDKNVLLDKYELVHFPSYGLKVIPKQKCNTTYPVEL